MKQRKRNKQGPNCPRPGQDSAEKPFSKGVVVFIIIILAWLVFAILVAMHVLPIF